MDKAINNKMRISGKILLTVLTLLSLFNGQICNAGTPLSKPVKDELLYSFAVVGCNRLDKADTNTVLNPSTANIEQ